MLYHDTFIWTLVQEIFELVTLFHDLILHGEKGRSAYLLSRH